MVRMVWWEELSKKMNVYIRFFLSQSQTRILNSLGRAQIHVTLLVDCTRASRESFLLECKVQLYAYNLNDLRTRSTVDSTWVDQYALKKNRKVKLWMLFSLYFITFGI